MNGTQNLWIVKPGGLSRGRNIRIFDKYLDICEYAEITAALSDNPQSDKKQIATTQKSWVCQKYIENPLIILNRKFDIRVWVVVTSWNPLKVFYWNKPYIRFGCQDYDPSNLSNLFSHLTNNSVAQKQIRMPDDKKFDKIP